MLRILINNTNNFKDQLKGKKISFGDNRKKINVFVLNLRILTGSLRGMRYK